MSTQVESIAKPEIDETPASAPSKPPVQAPPPARNRRKHQLIHHGIFLVVCTGAIFASFLLNINNSSHLATPFSDLQLPSLCQFRNLTGLDCPGCGLSRAFVSIGHGDLRAAWGYNPASVLVFAFVLLQIPYRAIQLWRISRGLPELYPRTIANIVLWIVVAALFTQWIVKTASWVFVQ